MFVPSRRRDSDGGGVAVELGRSDGVDDGLFGNLGRPKAGEGRRVAVAQRNNGPWARFFDIIHDLIENTSYGYRRRRVQHLVSPEPPLLCCGPVFHLSPPLLRDSIGESEDGVTEGEFH